jgi:hypothetical protein
MVSASRSRLAAVALVVLALVWGLAPATAQEADNCRLLTQNEVETLFKTQVEPPHNTMLGCAWVPKGKSLSYLTVLQRDGKVPVVQVLAPTAPDISVRQIPGLGDDAAVSLRNNKSVLNLVAQKGDRQVRFNCPFLGVKVDTPRFEQLKALMAKALERP